MLILEVGEAIIEVLVVVVLVVVVSVVVVVVVVLVVVVVVVVVVVAVGVVVVGAVVVVSLFSTSVGVVAAAIARVGAHSATRCHRYVVGRAASCSVENNCDRILTFLLTPFCILLLPLS